MTKWSVAQKAWDVFDRAPGDLNHVAEPSSRFQRRQVGTRLRERPARSRRTNKPHHKQSSKRFHVLLIPTPGLMQTYTANPPNHPGTRVNKGRPNNADVCAA